MSIRARLSSRPRMTLHEGGGRASASWIRSHRNYVPHRPWRGSSEGPINLFNKFKANLQAHHALLVQINLGC